MTAAERLARPLVALLLAGCAVQAAPGEPIVVAGAIRVNADEEWHVIEDATHRPQGIASVTSDGSTVTVHFERDASAVITFVATPDETLVAEGIELGASVGTDHAVITLSEMPSGEWANIWVYGLLEP